MSNVVIEHGESTLVRRFRRNRVRAALVVAALEGILVLAGAIPWWFVVLLALGALAVYAAWGREHRSPEVRVVTWTAAVSQLLVVVVPLAAGALVVLAVVVVVLLAGPALAALLLDRR
jgi:predicted hotdog family 3-hydroxylacyl-ACP dehydratase